MNTDDPVITYTRYQVIQLLIWNLIKGMIWRKAMILIGVTLLAMTGVGLVVLLLFFLAKQMMNWRAVKGHDRMVMN